MTDTRLALRHAWYLQDGEIFDSYGDSMYNAEELQGTNPYIASLIDYGAHKPLADRDAELGRWRSVARPDCVVYPSPDRDDSCTVLDEVTGFSVVTSLAEAHDDFLFSSRLRIVGREYFAAHPVPEPKPWEDAASGELWSLMTADGDAVYLAILADDYGMEFVGLKDRFSAGYTGITAGRRIWPEVSE